MKTMMDGTLRISFDIEPTHAQDAFRLFAAPGTPAAIAALKDGFAAKSDDEPTPYQPEPKPAEKIKGGELSKRAGILCADPAFRQWLGGKTRIGKMTEDGAAKIIRNECLIESRAQLDHDLDAAHIFRCEFDIPFAEWMRS